MVEVNKGRRTGHELQVHAPEKCPVCHTAVARDEELVVIRCPNPECPEQVKRRIEHFTHRGAMDIRGLGESVVAQLVDHKLVSGPADLYDLNELLLAQLERQGTKSIDNMLKAIEESKTQPPWRLIFGIGILHVGANSSRKLLEHFGSIEKVAAATVDELAQCQDIGGIVAPSVHEWFRTARNIEVLARLKAAGLTFAQRETVPASDKLNGTVWVLTGTLSQPREEVAEIIRANGGKISGSVSAKTTYLLAGDEAGSKLDKAAKLGVKVLDEAAFKQMLA